MDLFNRSAFKTPESVELEFTLAGIGNRAYALLIDYVALWGIQIIYLIFLLIFPEFIAKNFEAFLPGVQNIQLWIISILILIFFATYVGYFVFFETLWQGQTPGKRLVKIRVIRDDGRPVGLQQATLRALLRPIDDILFLGAFFIVLGKQEKRLGDWLAGTLVIQEERPDTPVKISLSDSLSQEARTISEKLLVEANISRLLPEDFAVIREYLQRRKGMLPQARRELARKLAYQVKDIIALEDVPDGLSANCFLEATYLAYQQQYNSHQD